MFILEDIAKNRYILLSILLLGSIEPQAFHELSRVICAPIRTLEGSKSNLKLEDWRLLGERQTRKLIT